ncbi:MAG TPA: response regulator transcription factor [Thiothrix sp.]|nr:response regulator transcription factor [Thiothrix sp.]
MTHIVIVEDNPAIAEMLLFHMKEQHYQTSHFADGELARQFLLTQDYNLVVLDIMLPSCNGLDICKELRQKNPAIPVLLLTALDSEIDRVIGLELGADDYLTKPFSMRECLARIKALLRRSQLSLANTGRPSPEEHKTLLIDELSINASSRVVSLDNKRIELTAREFDLLLHLAQHRGRVYSRSQLLDSIWGYSHDGYEHTINTHINRLRNKLKRTKNQTDFIETVWGIGYKFSDIDKNREGEK